MEIPRDGCDGAVFDPTYCRIYASNGEGTMTVVQEENRNSFMVLETVSTQQGARTIALSSSTHHIYLPAASFGPPAEGGGRRKPIPGSFVILDIETVK